MNPRIGIRLCKTAAAFISVILIGCSPAYAAPKMAAANAQCIDLFKDFVFASAPKAFALSEIVKTGPKRFVQGCGSSWGAGSQRLARQRAVARCRLDLKKYPKAANTCQVVNLRYVIEGPPPLKIKKNWQ